MKTLLKPFQSLSAVLHDSPELPVANKVFRNTPDLFDTQLKEEANSYLVSVPVPGLSKEDLRIHIEGRVLVISAREKSKLAKSTGSLKYRVLHSFLLSAGVDANQIQAKCRNGLLTVHIKKVRSKKNRVIIKVGHNNNPITNASLLNSWWERAKEKIALAKLIPNVKMIKT